MNLEKLTSSFQTALQAAQTLAQEKNQATIDAAHVLTTMLGDLDSSVPALLRYTGVDVGKIKAAVKSSRAISRPSRNRITPPAIRKAGSEIPKKASNDRPEK